MKQILYFLMTTIVLTSCANTMITHPHAEIMNGFKTKDQVISKFGLPTTKKNEGEYEEWYYDFGTKKITQGVANANGSATGGIKTTSNYYSGTSKQNNVNVNAQAASTVVSQEVNYFVRFTFKESTVINWKSKGVNYTYYQIINKKTNQEVGTPSAPKFN